MPGEILENLKKLKFFDWLPCKSSVTAYIVLPKKFCGNKNRVSPGDKPLAKEAKENGYEIANAEAIYDSFVGSGVIIILD